MVALSVCLSGFTERMKRKEFLKLLTKGWERSIGIVVEDRQLRFALHIDGEKIEWIEWPQEQPADLILFGTERDLQDLFGGEELAFLHAKQQIRLKGAIRDQLKLEALIRLSIDKVAI